MHQALALAVTCKALTNSSEVETHPKLQQLPGGERSVAENLSATGTDQSQCCPEPGGRTGRAEKHFRRIKGYQEMLLLKERLNHRAFTRRSEL
jgi:hypothetical protein